jgi:hypothetical protein
MRPGVREADGIARFDGNDGRQIGVENAEPHRLLGGLDDMYTTRITALAARGGCCRGRLRLRELSKPWLYRSQQSHETAGAHQIAARAAARAQIGVQSFLVDFVCVQQTVRGSLLVCRVLDVLTQNAGSLLVAAAEQVAAFVMVMQRLGCLVMVLRHGVPPRSANVFGISGWNSQVCFHSWRHPAGRV